MTSSRLRASALERMHRVLSGYIERREMPGLVALVSHDDEVHVETIGARSFDESTPMKRDTIFRIASLTKPITAVAAMILVEECLMRLDDPIDRWVPELANRRVMRSLASLEDTVPATRPISVRDVLTYRMGFGTVLARPNSYPIQKLIRDYNIGGDGPPLPSKSPSTEKWLQSLGSLPWLAQPGEKWSYQVSGDVLGVLIARVSGKSLGAFLKERIFDPLGMKDTSFAIPEEKRDRFTKCYRLDRQTNSVVLYDDVANSTWGGNISFESGAGGLVSTLDDYFAFSRMMLNKGTLAGEQILSRASVEFMTSDQLTPENRAGSEMFFRTHSSWGLGVGVDIKREEIYHNPGRYGWTGGTGTTAYNDPGENMIGILFTQRMMDSPEPPKYFSDFWTLAYSALE